MSKIQAPKISNGVKAVLFDIDGVLLDSFNANLKYFRNIFARAGYSRPTKKEYRKAFNTTFTEVLEQLAAPKTKEELERLRSIGEAEPYPMRLLKAPREAKNILRLLAKKYKLGIVSGRRRIGVQRYFIFAKTKQYFSAIVSCEDSQNHKPHPEPLLLAAKRLKLRPSECVYIGDSHTDIEAGKAAGMKTMLYGGKRNPDADLAAASFKRLPLLIAAL